MNKMLQDAGIEIPFDYVDADTGEGYTDYELHVMFDEFLNEVHGTASIAGMTYDTARVFKEVDPTTYSVSFDDWIYFQIEDKFIVRTEDFEDDE